MDLLTKKQANNSFKNTISNWRSNNDTLRNAYVQNVINRDIAYPYVPTGIRENYAKSKFINDYAEQIYRDPDNDPRNEASIDELTSIIKQIYPNMDESFIRQNYRGIMKGATGYDMDAKGIMEVFHNKFWSNNASANAGINQYMYLLGANITNRTEGDKQIDLEERKKYLTEANKYRRTDYFTEFDSFFEKSLLNFADMGPSSAVSTILGIAGTIIGSAVGGPAGLLVGRGIASAISGIYMGLVEAGGLAIDLFEAGVPDNIALKYSTVHGTVASILEGTGDFLQNKIFEPLSAIMKGSGAAVSKAFVKTIQEVLVQRGKDYLNNLVTEPTEEALQELSSMWFTNLAIEESRRKGINIEEEYKLSKEKIIDSMKYTFKKTFSGQIIGGLTQSGIAMLSEIYGGGKSGYAGNIRAIIDANKYSKNSDSAKLILTNSLFAKANNKKFSEADLRPIRAYNIGGIYVPVKEDAELAGYAKKNGKAVYIEEVTGTKSKEAVKTTKTEAESNIGAVDTGEEETQKGIRYSENGEIVADEKILYGLAASLASIKDTKAVKTENGRIEITYDDNGVLKTQSFVTSSESELNDYSQTSLASTIREARLKYDDVKKQAAAKFKEIINARAKAEQVFEDYADKYAGNDAELRAEITIAKNELIEKFGSSQNAKGRALANTALIMSFAKASGKTFSDFYNSLEIQMQDQKFFEKASIFGNIMLNDKGKFEINISKNHSATTLAHELAHAFMITLGRENWDSIDGFSTIYKDYIAFDEKNGDKTYKSTLEKFSDDFEKYLRSGKSSDSALRTVFDQLVEVVNDILNRFRGNIDERTLKMFDNLLSGNLEEKAEEVNKVDTSQFKNVTYTSNQDISRLTEEAQKQYDEVIDPSLSSFSTQDAGLQERPRLIEQGYDGVINTENGKAVEYVAFNANQIKSATDNNGEFSPFTGVIYNQDTEYVNPLTLEKGAEEGKILKADLDVIRKSVTLSLNHAISNKVRKNIEKVFKKDEGISDTANSIISSYISQIDPSQIIKELEAFDYETLRKKVTEVIKRYQKDVDIFKNADASSQDIKLLVKDLVNLEVLREFERRAQEEQITEDNIAKVIEDIQKALEPNGSAYKELMVNTARYEDGSGDDFPDRPLSNSLMQWAFDKIDGKVVNFKVIASDTIQQTEIQDSTEAVKTTEQPTETVETSSETVETSEPKQEEEVEGNTEELAPIEEVIKKSKEVEMVDIEVEEPQNEASAEQTTQEILDNQIPDLFDIEIIQDTPVQSEEGLKDKLLKGGMPNAGELVRFQNTDVGRTENTIQHIIKNDAKIKDVLNYVIHQYVLNENIKRVNFTEEDYSNVYDLFLKKLKKDGIELNLNTINDGAWFVRRFMAYLSYGTAENKQNLWIESFDGTRKSQNVKKTARALYKYGLISKEAIKGNFQNELFFSLAKVLYFDARGANVTNALIEEAVNEIKESPSLIRDAVLRVEGEVAQADFETNQLKAEGKYVSDLRISDIKHDKYLSKEMRKALADYENGNANGDFLKHIIKEADKRFFGKEIDIDLLSTRIDETQALIDSVNKDIERLTGIQNGLDIEKGRSKVGKEILKLQSKIDSLNLQLNNLKADRSLLSAKVSALEAIREANKVVDNIKKLKNKGGEATGKRHLSYLIDKLTLKDFSVAKDGTIQEIKKTSFTDEKGKKLVRVSETKVNILKELSPSSKYDNGDGYLQYRNAKGELVSLYQYLLTEGIIDADGNLKKIATLVDTSEDLKQNLVITVHKKQFSETQLSKRQLQALKKVLEAVAKYNIEIVSNRQGEIEEVATGFVYDFYSNKDASGKYKYKLKDKYKEIYDNFIEEEGMDEDEAFIRAAKIQAYNERGKGTKATKEKNKNFFHRYWALQRTPSELLKHIGLGKVQESLQQMWSTLLKESQTRLQGHNEALKDAFEVGDNEVEKTYKSFNEDFGVVAESDNWIKEYDVDELALISKLNYSKDFKHEDIITKGELFGIYLFSYQLDGLKILIENNNFTPEQIAYVRELFKKDEFKAYKQYADYILKDSSSKFPTIKRIAKDTDNIELREVKNYLPLVYTDGKTTLDLMMPDENDNGIKHPDLVKTFLRERVGSSYPLDLNIIANIEKMIMAQEKYIAGAKLFKELGQAFNGTDGAGLYSGIATEYSDDMANAVKEIIANNRNNSTTKEVITGTIDFLRANRSMAKLSFNFSSVFQQLGSLPLACDKYSPRELAQAMIQVTKDKDFVNSRSSFMRSRSNADISMAKAVRTGIMSDSKVLASVRKFAEVGMKPIEVLDKWVAESIWATSYINSKENGKTEEEAIKIADDFTFTVQSNTNPLYSPLMYQTKDSLVKMALMFTNQLSKQFNMIVSAVETKDFKQIGRTMASLSMALMFACAVTGKFIPDDDDDDKFIETLLKGMKSEAISLIPYFGTTLKSIDEGWVYQQKDDIVSTTFAAINTATSPADTEKEQKKKLSKLETAISNMTYSAMDVIGAPSVGAKRVKQSIDLMRDDYNWFLSILSTTAGSNWRKYFEENGK